MIILETSALLERFKTNIENAHSIDMAVAWLGPSIAFDELANAIKERNLRVRLAVGLSGNATNPIALTCLQALGAEIRIPAPRYGIFHPKFYLFRSANKNVCWLGSANFTLAGFSQNQECVNEFLDDGTSLNWFERLWLSLPKRSAATIIEYSKNWVRPQLKQPTSRPKKRQKRPELPGKEATWNQFIRALEKCNEYWENRRTNSPGTYISIFGESWSWIDTITNGHEIARRPTWQDLNFLEMRVLLGRDTTKDASGAWGLLGSMGARGAALSKFYYNREIRSDIRSALQPVMEANGQPEFISACQETISKVRSFDDFGSAIATRLITLARPELGVSVNGGSAPELACLAGLPRTPSLLGNERNYPKLLKWVYEKQWYSQTEPKNAFERTLWKMRAALVDAFVYEPVKSKSKN